MRATEEGRQHISSILKEAGIYHDILVDYDPETNIEGDCTSIYIDGDISFDIMAEIVDYLREYEK